MTKMKKLKNHQYSELTKNMSEEDKNIYDLLLSLQNNFDKQVKQLHVELFKEEYDFMYDSGVDASERTKGNNPMSSEYIEKRDKKRVALGFNPLEKDGEPSHDDDTLEYCKKLITKEIEFK